MGVSTRDAREDIVEDIVEELDRTESRLGTDGSLDREV